MRARIKKTANIVQVPDDFARLTTITQNGYFIYKIKYRIDPVKAVRAKTFNVRISLSDRPQVKQTVQTFTNFNPQLLTNRLLTRRSLLKDIARQEQADRFFTYVSDITKKIPNSSTIQLSRSSIVSPPLLTKDIKIKPALVLDLQRRNLSLPVLDQNINRNTLDDNISSAGAVRVASNRMLINNRIDPAAFAGRRTNTIRSAPTAMAGVIGSRTIRTLTENPTGKLLIGSLLNNRRFFSQIQVPTQTYMNVVTREENSWIEIEETLRVPIGDVESDEFFTIFELENPQGIIIQTISKAVAHNKNVSTLQIPVIPPEVIAIGVGRQGKAVLNIKQKDKNATSINIYRREIKKGSPNTDAQYDFVGSVDAEFGEDFKKVEDIFATTNPVIYRFVPVNSNNVLGADFSSIVTQQRRGTVAPKASYFRRTYFLSIAHQILENSVLVTIRDVPTGPIAIQLQKKDRTINQQTFSNIGSITLIDQDTNAPILFEDVNVKPNRIYEYRAKLLFADGAVEISSNNLLVEFTPIESNILQLNISEPTTQESGDNIDVQFVVEKSVVQRDFDLIKTFLQEQGLTTEFQDQLLANRDQFQDLFAVNVTRTNLNTGELEDFGIIDGPNFSDQRFGSIKSVKPLQPGFDYQYNVTAFARNIETLMPTLEKTVSSQTNVSFSYAPAKWRHPVTLQQGNIVTDRTLLRNHAKNKFTFGTVVDSKIINVSLADVLPSLYDGKATQLGTNKVFIQWKAQGNINKIDHFIVILDILGIKTVVGKSHNITNSNYFQFVDELTNKECGELTYFITPVFFDYSRGPELKTNPVVI